MMVTMTEDERVLRIWEAFAPSYDRTIAWVERLLFPGGRQWVCSRARGRVLEIAAGTGRNLPYYPPGVELVAIEYSPAMLALARDRARALGTPVELRLGDAQDLDFPNGSFDVVVCTLALCSIPDDRRAVAEVARVLRPHGRFVLLEHVRSPLAPIRWLERLLDPLAVRAQADHLLRDPLDHLEPCGFAVEELHRTRLGVVELVTARRLPGTTGA
jgi:ubiquinone/menaquinone biosynthesis C-methylase UbiE